MKEHTVNKFYKGVNTDMAWLERQGDMILDGLNIRLTAKDTDGLFAANFNGNREEFSLSEGFLPIGATEYGGILFILSTNSSTGKGEIGSFPTPKGDGSGFDRIYSPLNNYTLDNPNVYTNPCEGEPLTITRAPFKTTALKFSCEHQARLLARLDFDKSINLYWTDNYNPIRSINTGFHSITGEYNERYVSQNMIERGNINVVSENEFIPIVDLSTYTGAGGPPPPVGNNGQLKAGHYFFFVRYTDIAFNSSSFLGMSGPVPIFHEEFTNGQGTFNSENNLRGLESQEKTNRDVNLIISGLDKAAAFIEVGYVYYYGKDEFETKLIDVRHAINSNDSVRVNIIGTESTIDLSIDEFIGYKPTDSFYCKDIAQLDNRLYLANTRGIELDHPDIRSFCCEIKIQETYSKKGKVSHVFDNGTALYTNEYARNPLDVNRGVGYFSGETYIFACVPIFKGGFSGPAFPITGYDNFTGTPLNENKDGIFRFSSAKVNYFHDGSDAWIKGVNFEMSTASLIYDNSAFLKENLIGIYFTRGERIPNILYQGILVDMYSQYTPLSYGLDLWVEPQAYWNSKVLAGVFAKYTENRDGNKAIPLMEAAIPYVGLWWEQIPVTLFEFANVETIYRDISIQTITPGLAYGVFSLDYYLDKGQGKEGVAAKSFIDPIGTPLDWQDRKPNSEGGINNLITGFPLNNLFYYRDISPFNVDGWNAPTYNVDGWDTRGIELDDGRLFISKIGEGTRGPGGLTTDGFSFFLYDRDATNNNEYLISLPIAVPDYILLDRTEEEPSGVKLTNKIVNVSRINPKDIIYKEVYDFKNTLFSTIGHFVSIKKVSDVLAINGRNFYQGDCFIARNYLKVLHGFTDEMGDEIIDVLATGDATIPTFGLALGLVTENNYNPYYRIEKGRNKFYPNSNSGWIKESMDSPESNFYNTGYTRMLNPRQFLGIDILKPTSDNAFPTRIRPSFKHVLNSLKDGYLQFSDSKDFDFQYGPINALIVNGDQLYSFQDDAINLHPTNERSVSPSDGTDVPFVLGESRGLTEFKRAISTKYGTQHQWSIIKGEGGIYGFDWNKKVYWQVTSEGFKNLGLSTGCEKWIEDVTNLQSSGVSDITEQLPDNPVCNLGIHSTYNTEYKEVVTTFIFGEDKNKTLVFSEKGGHFGPKHSYTPVFYAELERDMYSFADGKFWLHESNPLRSNFYGVQHPSFIEVVVNPKGEIAKHFDNLIINSNNREFSKITYTTQHQIAIQDPFLGKFFCKSVYREMQWKLPIRRADNVEDPQLSLAIASNSRMRGRYIIINLEYAGSQDLWIREIITAYTQSHG